MDEDAKITAQDIRHQEFSVKMRGYDRSEVEEFLSTVADMLEKDTSERSELRQKIELLEKQLQEFKNLEATLKNTLIRTEESAEDVKRAAERESELIIREAKVKADKMYSEKMEELHRVESSYEAMQAKWNEYYIKFKNLLTSHLEILEKMQQEYKTIGNGGGTERS